MNSRRYVINLNSNNALNTMIIVYVGMALIMLIMLIMDNALLITFVQKTNMPIALAVFIGVLGFIFLYFKLVPRRANNEKEPLEMHIEFNRTVVRKGNKVLIESDAIPIPKILDLGSLSGEAKIFCLLVKSANSGNTLLLGIHPSTDYGEVKNLMQGAETITGRYPRLYIASQSIPTLKKALLNKINSIHSQMSTVSTFKNQEKYDQKVFPLTRWQGSTSNIIMTQMATNIAIVVVLGPLSFLLFSVVGISRTSLLMGSVIFAGVILTIYKIGFKKIISWWKKEDTDLELHLDNQVRITKANNYKSEWAVSLNEVNVYCGKYSQGAGVRRITTYFLVLDNGQSKVGFVLPYTGFSSFQTWLKHSTKIYSWTFAPQYQLSHPQAEAMTKLIKSRFNDIEA